MPYTREQLIDRIQQAAAGIGFDPNVAVAQHRRESANFRNDVVYGPFVGGAGERGVSQFTPGTWARFGSGPHTNAYDPEASLAAWSAYTSYLMRLFNSDYSKVLMGYNGGEGHITNPGKYGAPSAAAQRYAREVLAEAGKMPSPIPQPQPDGGSGSGATDDGWEWFGPDDDWLPDSGGSGDKSKTNWTLIAGVGAIALIALVALDD